jgi:hypothetical protein
MCISPRGETIEILISIITFKENKIKEYFQYSYKNTQQNPRSIFFTPYDFLLTAESGSKAI